MASSGRYLPGLALVTHLGYYHWLITWEKHWLRTWAKTGYLFGKILVMRELCRGRFAGADNHILLFRVRYNYVWVHLQGRPAVVILCEISWGRFTWLMEKRLWRQQAVQFYHRLV